MTSPVILADGRATLYLGDCREILPTLGNVDALIWDPPWGINFAEYESHKDKSDEYPQWINHVVDVAESRVENGWCVVFQGARRAWEWSTLINRKYRIMACAKNFTQILPGAGPLWSTDFALFWARGTPTVEHGRGRDFHIANTANMSRRPKGHPCPRPLDQMEYVLHVFTEAGMTILDPTFGSGTTGVAAINIGRRFIGIEIEPKYFDIACRRIDDASRQADMFAEPAPPEKQEVMPI